MRNSRFNLEFAAATVSLLMAFAASATPIPLYDLYRRTEGLTYGDLSLTAVVYFVGAVTALLIFGRISNHLGRKPVTFMVFALSAAASVILLDVGSARPLIFGRLLLGLACGLASSAIAAYVVESAPEALRWLAAVILANAPMVGLTLGALVSGALVEYAPYPRVLCYAVILCGLAACGVLVALCKETVARTPGLVASFRPLFALPHADRRTYPVAACTFVATWALGGFYQAFGPSIAASQFGEQNAFTGALVFSSYLLPSALGGPLTARFAPSLVQRVGMAAYTLAVAGLLVSIRASALSMFLLMGALAGMFQGAVLTGSIRTLLEGVTPQGRAGILSLIYATSYAGAAIPSFLAGQLSHFMSLLQIAICYGVLAALACLVTLLFARTPMPQAKRAA